MSAPADEAQTDAIPAVEAKGHKGIPRFLRRFAVLIILA